MTVSEEAWLRDNTDSPFWGAVLIGLLTVDEAEDAERALKRAS